MPAIYGQDALTLRIIKFLSGIVALTYLSLRTSQNASVAYT